MEAPLKTKIIADLKDAFRSGDKHKKTVLSLINAAIKNEEVNARVDQRKGILSDADILGLIRREMKQHEESLSEAQNAKREDLADEALQELDVLRSYLPKQLSHEEVTALAKQIIAEVGAKTAKDQGAVMKAIQPKVKDIADGKMVNEVVRSLLA